MLLNFYLILFISYDFFTFFFKNFFYELNDLIICSIKICPKHSWNSGENIKEWINLRSSGLLSNSSDEKTIMHSSTFPPVFKILTISYSNPPTPMLTNSIIAISMSHAAILARVLQPLLVLLSRITWELFPLIAQYSLCNTLTWK
jgi:hypothetical protein